MATPRDAQPPGGDAGPGGPGAGPPWYVYALIAAFAGGGGGFLGNFADPMRTNPTARPDAYTATMADRDFDLRDAAVGEIKRRQEHYEQSFDARCESVQSRLNKIEGLLLFLERQHNDGNGHVPNASDVRGRRG